ncbi:MAG TPA: hypothetical protein VJW17_16050 [Pyrinomonadaceae bacterium]|nr:hypothetical protein [Pyrinomonadaceae bacterium]
MEQSQKRGIRSDAQKQQRARQGYEPIPPAKPVAGAFGEHKQDTANDQEVSLKKANKRPQKDN